jgi:hypothetical protein
MSSQPMREVASGGPTMIIPSLELRLSRLFEVGLARGSLPRSALALGSRAANRLAQARTRRSPKQTAWWGHRGTGSSPRRSLPGC